MLCDAWGAEGPLRGQSNNGLLIEFYIYIYIEREIYIYIERESERERERENTLECI